MDILVERNTELRDDLLRQNQLVSQMRKKIYGAEVDCSDVNQLPNRPAAVRSWHPAVADGLFYVARGTTGLYVKLSDYREMADHAVVLRNSIPLLEQEKRKLKVALQERKTMNNELVVKMLNGEVREEEEFGLNHIDDVD